MKHSAGTKFFILIKNKLMEKETRAKAEESKEEIRVNNFYDYATKRNEVLKNVPESQVKLFIGELIKEIDLLEEVAERDKGKLDLPDDIAKKIGAIWEVSGVGTYFEPQGEGSRYKDYPWSDWMDRARLNYTAMLIRKITEKASGQDFKAPLSEIALAKKRTKEAISKYGPYVIYNGGQLQDEAVLKILAQEGTIIPKEKAEVIGGNIDNTINQMKTFKLPDGFEKGKEIAIVAHAPQLVRILRMINRYKPFPEGTKIRLFPVPTPAEGKEQYAKMEVSGTLYYTLITKDATEEPYPYEISYSS